ncbi:hypothetical protein G9A89_002682 [Geosiphon pyriformis]|nr:hypothetical protein G9A89_002682 [Geosiphon pyriformis]
MWGRGKTCLNIKPLAILIIKDKTSGQSIYALCQTLSRSLFNSAKIDKNHIKWENSRRGKIKFSNTNNSFSERIPRVPTKTPALLRDVEWEVNYAKLVREAIAKRDADLAWKLYSSQKRRGLFYVDYRNLAWLLKRNGESKNEDSSLSQRIKQIEIVLSDLLNSGLAYDIDIYNALITACHTAGDLPRLQNIWEKIKMQKDLIPNSTTLCTLINAYSKDIVNFDKIMTIYDEFVQKGYLLNSRVFGTLITAFASSGHLEAAHKVLAHAEASGQQLDSSAHNALIQYYIQENYDLDAAINIYNRMNERKVIPNGVTFNLIIKGYMDKNLPETAMEFLNKEMLKKWNAPFSIVTFNILISGNFKAAAMAKFMGKEPESERYIETAREWYLLMLSQIITPDVVTFNTLIQGFGELGRITDVIKSVQEMQNLKIIPNLITFRNLVKFYGINKDSQGVKLVWNDMIKSGLEPDYRTIVAFLGAAKECNETAWAVQMIKSTQHIWLEKSGSFVLQKLAEFEDQKFDDQTSILIDNSQKENK